MVNNLNGRIARETADTALSKNKAKEIQEVFDWIESAAKQGQYKSYITVRGSSSFASYLERLLTAKWFTVKIDKSGAPGRDEFMLEVSW